MTVVLRRVGCSGRWARKWSRTSDETAITDIFVRPREVFVYRSVQYRSQTGHRSRDQSSPPSRVIWNQIWSLSR
jgi:hypothetical protein